MGQFEEAVKYAYFKKLPITFVIENNQIAVDTPTKKAWGGKVRWEPNTKTMSYIYKRKYPHYGIGEWIIFKDKKTKGVGDYQATKLK
jgi:TPP-dependent pyruvate/acetoin dehydrogenase alpha subunit